MFVCVNVCWDTPTYVYLYVCVWYLFYILYGTYLLVLTNCNKNNNKTSKGLLFSNNNKNNNDNNNNSMHLFVLLFIKWKDELWNITAKATTNLSICMPTTTTIKHTALANNMCVNLNFLSVGVENYYICVQTYMYICVCVSYCDKHAAAWQIIALQTRAHRKQPYAQAKTIVCTPIFAYMYIYICVCVRTTLFSLKTKLYYS